MMDDKDVQQASFLIRLWRKETQGTWHVWVQHIQSGEIAFPKSRTALHAFFERWIGKWDVPTRKGLK